jgi:hypothetical protein
MSLTRISIRVAAGGSILLGAACLTLVGVACNQMGVSAGRCVALFANAGQYYAKDATRDRNMTQWLLEDFKARDARPLPRLKFTPNTDYTYSRS